MLLFSCLKFSYGVRVQFWLWKAAQAGQGLLEERSSRADMTQDAPKFKKQFNRKLTKTKNPKQRSAKTRHDKMLRIKVATLELAKKICLFNSLQDLERRERAAKDEREGKVKDPDPLESAI